VSDAIFDELAGVEDNFNRAMVSNDAARIAACVSDDWVLVTPEGGPISGPASSRSSKRVCSATTA
jgi:ketosteroid isomerase-like protein